MISVGTGTLQEKNGTGLLTNVRYSVQYHLIK